MAMQKEAKSKNKKTNDIYLKGGVVCGDMEGTGEPGKVAGSGEVGGEPMGIHNGFAKGIPNEGKESIMAETMLPAHKANIAKSVLSTKEDKSWGGVITPSDMGIHHTFGA